MKYEYARKRRVVDCLPRAHVTCPSVRVVVCVCVCVCVLLALCTSFDVPRLKAVALAATVYGRRVAEANGLCNE